MITITWNWELLVDGNRGKRAMQNFKSFFLLNNFASHWKEFEGWNTIFYDGDVSKCSLSFLDFSRKCFVYKIMPHNFVILFLSKRNEYHKTLVFPIESQKRFQNTLAQNVVSAARLEILQWTTELAVFQRTLGFFALALHHDELFHHIPNRRPLFADATFMYVGPQSVMSSPSSGSSVPLHSSFLLLV